jgi:hypothetical protein
MFTGGTSQQLLRRVSVLSCSLTGIRSVTLVVHCLRWAFRRLPCLPPLHWRGRHHGGLMGVTALQFLSRESSVLL